MNSNFCRIAIVDACPVFRLGLVALLNKIFQPNLIEEASNCSSFQSIVMNKSSRLDMVVLDVNLSGTDVVTMVDMARSFSPI